MRWFISLRYFLSHKRQSLVCIAGVTISVTVFIAMTSMMWGFTEKFIIETVESTGHITIFDEPRQLRTPILEQAYPHPHALLVIDRVKPRDRIEQIRNPTGLLATLRRLPGIQAVAPIVRGDVIATFGTRTVNLSILGIEPDQQVAVTTIGEKVVAGSFDHLRATADGLVLGRGAADNLGVELNDVVILSSPEGGRATAKVVGIFDTGVTPVDYGRGYMLVGNAQTLLDRRNIINEIILRTDDYTQAREYAAQIEAMTGYRTESWQETNANFLRIFRVQTIVTQFIKAALLIVAAFGVLNILIMSVLERVNDIAILKSIGLSRQDITTVFLIQGTLIGMIGASIGLIGGKIAIEALRRLPITMEGLVRTEGLIMTERPSQYVMAFVAAMVVVLLAAAYPARRAALYDPVEVIRGAH